MENIKNYSTLNPEIYSPVKKNNTNTSKYLNLFLSASFILLVISLTILVGKSQFANSSKAAGIDFNPATKTFSGHSPVSALSYFPKKYNNVAIPQKIYEEGAGKIGGAVDEKTREYINDRVVRYFVYKNILSQPIDTSNLTFNMITNELQNTDLENKVQEQLVTSIDFAYIKARFDFGVNKDKAQAAFPDLKNKATEEIKKYRQQLENANNDVDSIVKVVLASNTDADMQLINNHEENKFFIKYHPDNKVFVADTGFDNFVLQQPLHTVSKTYTVKLEDGTPAQYVIVYIFKTDRKQYNNIDELITAQLPNFSN